MQRFIYIDVCDYTNKPLCSLYDSRNKISGQATEIIVHTERNGAKELRFKLPSTCSGETEERNYRLDYLVSDYRIKVITSKETDWFLISESKVTHSNFSTNYDIVAKHISSLLSTKNLNLEFSDAEGNNTGTIGQLAAVILEGTGWHLDYVASFMEDDKYGLNKEKVRSFEASAKTDAFRMMSSLCELFDAKPIYHGEHEYTGYTVKGTSPEGELEIYGENYDSHEADLAIQTALNSGWENLEKYQQQEKLVGRTVDIIPMNPFSENLEEGQIPKEVLEGENVLELYYDKNVSNITRTLNTENLVTNFYAYGSYGDRNGMASLQNAEHAEILFSHLEPGNYCFEFFNSKFFFTVTEAADNLKWSALDFTSRSYVYNGTQLYKVYRTTDSPYITITGEVSYVKNRLPNLMDFTYYDKIGLLDNNMLLNIAQAQSELPGLHVAAEEASLSLINAQSELARTTSDGGGFVKLDILSWRKDNGYLQLLLNKAKYTDGVIYRSDYTESKRNYFSWNTALYLKDNGEAISGKGAVIYLIHQGNPTKWEKVYAKAYGNGTDNYYRDSLNNIYELHNEIHYDHKEPNVDGGSYFPSVTVAELNTIYVADDTKKLYVVVNNDYTEIQASGYSYGMNEFEHPDTITLWTNNETWDSDTIVYLFSSDSIAGVFGPREDSVASNAKSIEEATKVSTEIHPMLFIYNDDDLPTSSGCHETYGWCYRSYTNVFEFGDLYFCWGKDGDVDWSQVYVTDSDDNPETIDIIPGYNYYYSTKRMKLYKARDEEKYTVINKPESVDEGKVETAFKAVITGCINQEILTKGYCERYNYSGVQTSLTQGNYTFKNEFGNYILFSTDKDATNASLMHYMSATRKLWINNSDDSICGTLEYSSLLLEFPKKNEFDDITFSSGDKNGAATSDGGYYVSQPINKIREKTVYEYKLPYRSVVMFKTQDGKKPKDSEGKEYPDIVVDSEDAAEFTTPEHTASINVICHPLNIKLGWKPEAAYLRGAIIEHENIVYYCYSDHISASTFEEDKSNWGKFSDCYIRIKNYDKILYSKDIKYNIIEFTGVGERQGLSYLMDKFITLSDEAYLNKLPALRRAQQKITDVNLSLSNTLGDMYREGYWQETKYVEGDEDKLYSDALDNLKEISHPQATYEVTYLDLYGSDDNLGAEVKTEWPDVDITYAAHLVDTDIDTNCWAYIDSIDKCYDQPWKTTIDINTRLSMIGQQSFTDVLGKIAEIANEVKAKQSVYERSANINDSGSMAAEKLEGAIQASKVYLLGGTSNWRTDEKGNIIFEAADGGSAMMLSGRGLMISNSKDNDGDWEWRTALSGQGFNADTITTGTLSATHILAGSITTDKISSTLGNEIDISSNASLALFATTDGSRPVGSLMTQHPNEGDSWIEIAADDGTTPAHIDIQTGGLLNLYGGSAMNLESGGSISIKADSSINIEADGIFTIDSENFSIQYNEITDKYDVEVTGLLKTVEGAKIAGFTVGKTNTDPSIDYMYSGDANSFDDNTPGIYIGTNGIRLGSNFKVTSAGNITAESVDISGRITAGLDSVIGSFNINTAIYSGTKSEINTDVVGVYIGTGGIGLGKIPQGSDKSAFQVGSDGSLYAASADISGKIKATDGSIAGWHIGSDYLGNADTAANSTIGFMPLESASTDAAIWAGGQRANPTFKVTGAGKLYATDAEINGSITSGSSITGSTIINGSLTIGTTTINASGMKVTGNADITGKITATSGKIGDFTINNAIYYGRTSLDAGVGGVYIGKDGISIASGSSGSHTLATFKVDSETGTVAANNVSISGGSISIGNTTINSSGGSIGGWTIGQTTLSGSNIILRSSGVVSPYNSIEVGESSNFRVTNGGLMYATAGFIGGTNGWIISDSGIMSGNCLIAGGDAPTIQFNGFLVNGTDGSFSANHGQIGEFHFSPTQPLGYSTLTANSGSYYVDITSPFKKESGGDTYPVFSVGSGTVASSRNFRIIRDGTVYFKQGYVNGTAVTSSREVKHNINKLIIDTSIIDKLNPVSFVYNNDEDEHTRFGLIYEDVIKLIPEVCYNSGEVKGINYTELIPILIKEIQDLRKRIKVLEGDKL